MTEHENRRPRRRPRTPGEATQFQDDRRSHRVRGLDRPFEELLPLARRYPELIAPLSRLAFKTGYSERAQEFLGVALAGEAPDLDYFAVAVRHYRDVGDSEQAFRSILDALGRFLAAPDRYPPEEDEKKLLPLLRQGFAMLLFDIRKPDARPDFVEAVRSSLTGLAERMGRSAPYHALLAQALWFSDRETSEQHWDQAAELDAETGSNARATWYKETEGDLDKAEAWYRKGMERAPASALLFHNLSQLLLERARRAGADAELAQRLLGEAEALVRAAQQQPGGSNQALLRNIEQTAQAIAERRAALGGGARADGGQVPPPAPPLEVGQVRKGRISNVTTFGAFVDFEGGQSGLIHRSQIAHQPVNDPGQHLKKGQEVEVKVLRMEQGEDGRPRVALSIKALTEPPPGSAGERPRGRPRPPRDARPQDRGQPAKSGAPRGLATLGDLLKAKEGRNG